MSRAGTITLENNELLVRFRKNQKRFDAISKIERATFDKDKRVWRIPVEQLSALCESGKFGTNEILFDFDLEEANRRIQEQEERARNALKSFKNNPFSVPEVSIALLNLDVVFRLDKSKESVRAHVKYRSRAKKCIADIPGAHYIKSETSYYLPVERLPSLIKKLRDRKFSFAVEKELGQVLQFSSDLRQRISAEPESGSAGDLSASLLTPYVMCVTDEPDVFALVGYTTEQLRSFLPGVSSYQAKKSLVAKMNLDTLLTLLYQVKQTEHRVWISREVGWSLEKKRSEIEQKVSENKIGFQDPYLGIVIPEICWVALGKRLAGLLIKRGVESTKSELEKLCSEFTPEILGAFPEHLFVSIPNTRLLEVFDKFEGEVSSTESFEKLIVDLRLRKKTLERRRYFQELRDIKLPEVEESLAAKLFPHQRVAVSWLLESPEALLGDDMGLGKTLSLLMNYEILRKRKEVDYLLVCCPNSLTRNWVREAKTWLPHLNLLLLPDTKKERIEFMDKVAEDSSVDGLVVHYEALRLDYIHPEIKNIVRLKKTLLCLDESQRAKNPTSKTFSALSSFSSLCPRRVCLTGTPTPKDISDIWAQMRIIDGGKRFGHSYYDWLKTVAELGNKWSEFAVKRFIPEEVDEAVAQVHEVLLRRRKEEVTNLPEKLFSIRDIALKGEQKKRFEEVREELLLRVSSVSGKTFVRQIDSILEEYLRAVQIGSNPRLVDEHYKGNPAKFVELDVIVDEVVKERGQKIVIWTNYLLNVRELVERYRNYGARPFSGEVSPDDREQTVRSFQEEQDGCRVLIAVPAAGGVGITLTAAQTAVYLEKTWNGEHWMQSVDRIHRIGQTGTVNIISLHASKVDDLIYYNLRRKERGQRRLLGDEARLVSHQAPSREELIQAVA